MNNAFGNSISSTAAEGRVGQTIGGMAMAAATLGGNSGFKRFLVEEVIFDPHELDENRIKDLQAKYGITEAAFLSSMPPNTVIGRMLSDGSSGHDRAHYLFPFFPPHLMLPAQAGEHVWAFFEEGKVIDYGFWLCRITEPRFVDDVNHTHADRKHHVTEKMKDAADKFGGAPDAKPGFDNGPTRLRDGEIVTSGVSASSSNVDQSAYEKLLKETDSSKVTDYESVPRYRKRPGDTALQGSNNTLIVLGTDRAGRTAEFEQTPKGKRVKQKPTKDQKGKAGTIDIVAGRGQNKKTEIKEIENSLGRKEGSKRKADENREEGDPDFAFDLSRVYVSMNTNADGNFELNFSSKDAPGPATIVKTDHIRLIARKTAKILVQPEAGAPESECAGFLLKDGNVIAIPAASGYVLLGGEDASMVPLCQPAAVKGGGQVSGPPITSTIGAQVGLGGPNGQFAKKVLMT
jgi:hypothetical protein